MRKNKNFVTPESSNEADKYSPSDRVEDAHATSEEACCTIEDIDEVLSDADDEEFDDNEDSEADPLPDYNDYGVTIEVYETDPEQYQANLDRFNIEYSEWIMRNPTSKGCGCS